MDPAAERPVSGRQVIVALAVAGIVPTFPYWSDWTGLDPVGGLIRLLDGDLMRANAIVLGLSGLIMMAGVALALRAEWGPLRFQPFRRHWLVTGPVLLLAASAATGVLQGDWAEAAAEATAAAVAPGNDMTLAGALIMVAGAGILAPLGEEMVFRGVLHPWLKGRFGAGVAIVAGGLLFGLFHVQPELATRAMALGVVLGFIRERTGSLWPCIAAHGVNNSLVVVIHQLVKLWG